MATISKEKSKTRKTPRPPSAKKSQPQQSKTIEQLTRERDEALRQLGAASDILRMIASSPIDVQPVLDVVAENAAKLCEATDANIYRREGNEYRIVAARGKMPIPRREEARPLTPWLGYR